MPIDREVKELIEKWLCKITRDDRQKCRELAWLCYERGTRVRDGIYAELDAAYAEIERLKKELENMETYIKAKNLIDSWPDWKKEIIGNKR